MFNVPSWQKLSLRLLIQPSRARPASGKELNLATSGRGTISYRLQRRYRTPS
jgi:hypothetical protein